MKAEAQIWGTETLFAGNYPVLIPYLWVKTDGRNLNLSLSHSNFGSSEMEVRISNLDQKMKFDYATATANIDLSMFHKELQGYVVVQAKGYGI